MKKTTCHLDRPLYAKGLCKPCYALMKYKQWRASHPTKKRQKGPIIKMIGKKFGRLTVIELDHDARPKGRVWFYWKCKCKCGKIAIARGDHLRCGFRVSCGCQKTEFVKAAKGKFIGAMPGTTWSRILKTAQLRGRTVTITSDDAAKLFETQKRKCALSGVDIQFRDRTQAVSETTASLDRIDSGLPYEIKNVQWVHKELNQMKSSFKQEVFVAWCQRVTQHQVELAKSATCPLAPEPAI